MSLSMSWDEFYLQIGDYFKCRFFYWWGSAVLQCQTQESRGCLSGRGFVFWVLTAASADDDRVPAYLERRGCSPRRRWRRRRRLQWPSQIVGAWYFWPPGSWVPDLRILVSSWLLCCVWRVRRRRSNWPSRQHPLAQAATMGPPPGPMSPSRHQVGEGPPNNRTSLPGYNTNLALL